MKLFYTAERSKHLHDPHPEHTNLCNWGKEDWEKIQDFNGIRTRDLREYHCDALPTELWRHTLRARSFLLGSLFFVCVSNFLFFVRYTFPFIKANSAYLSMCILLKYTPLSFIMRSLPLCLTSHWPLFAIVLPRWARYLLGLCWDEWFLTCISTTCS